MMSIRQRAFMIPILRSEGLHIFCQFALSVYIHHWNVAKKITWLRTGEMKWSSCQWGLLATFRDQGSCYVGLQLSLSCCLIYGSRALGSARSHMSLFARTTMSGCHPRLYLLQHMMLSLNIQKHSLTSTSRTRNYPPNLDPFQSSPMTRE